MLKVYYCEHCHRALYLQFEKDIKCRSCTNPMKKLNISYEKFSMLNEGQRAQIIKDELGCVQ
jgi:hypothetical protein